jgi:hypothetical protein
MAITSALITTSAANVYASVGNTAVTWLSITNYGAANATANVHVVPSGGTANVQNQIISVIEIVAGDTYQIYAGNEKLLLGNDDTVQAVANANTLLNAVTSFTSV